MKLSIIIPYYNTYDLTVKLIDELVRQTINRKDIEIILIDDGCNEKRLDKYKHIIKVIHSETNKGVSASRNIGLDICSGEYVVFIDSDDMTTQDYISTIIQEINKGVFDYCTFGWESNTKHHKVIDEIPKWNTSVWNCIYKRSLIGDYRFNALISYGEDEIFNKTIRKGISRMINKCIYIYNMTRTGRISDTI